MRRWHKIVAAVSGLLAIVYVGNASWAFGTPGTPVIVSHLGLEQRFDERGISLYDCKNDRMLPPTHGYLDNTIPSVAKAFELGAGSVNIDIHPTSDGEFVVFHDWTVDCRTNGHGVTRDLPLATLKSFDIGYRLTADGGQTYPFRGKFVGAMPSLDEVLRAFPGRAFTLVIKSKDIHEADLLLAYLRRHHADFARISVFGGDPPVQRLRQLMPHLRASSEQSVKGCLTRYLALGWTGIVPENCRNAIVPVPFNYRKLAWGWPNLFAERLRAVNSQLLLVGIYERHSDKPGMNMVNSDELAALPQDYSGAVFADRMEIIGPAARSRGWVR